MLPSALQFGVLLRDTLIGQMLLHKTHCMQSKWIIEKKNKSGSYAPVSLKKNKDCVTWWSQLWMDGLTYLFSAGFLCRPNCSSSAHSWTDTGTPRGWGAPTPAASRPNQVPCDRVSSGAGSESSARTASSGPCLSEVHWETDQVKTPRVLDLSALSWKGKTQLMS